MPVVATAAGAVPEVVGDGAVLVPPGDADALAAALGRVLDGGAAVDDLVARGRAAQRHVQLGARAPTGLATLYRDARAAPVGGAGQRGRR